MSIQFCNIRRLGVCLASCGVAIALNFAVAIAPVSAEVERMVYSLSVDDTQEFNDLIRQVESAVQAAIEQTFSTRSSVTEVSVQVIGDRNGEQVPVLTANVSRADWQRVPRIQAWAQYYGMSPVALLGFRGEEPERPTRSISFGYVPPLEGISANEGRTGSPQQLERREERLENDPAFRDD